MKQSKQTIKLNEKELREMVKGMIKESMVETQSLHHSTMPTGYADNAFYRTDSGTEMEELRAGKSITMPVADSKNSENTKFFKRMVNNVASQAKQEGILLGGGIINVDEQGITWQTFYPQSMHMNENSLRNLVKKIVKESLTETDVRTQGGYTIHNDNDYYKALESLKTKGSCYLFVGQISKDGKPSYHDARIKQHAEDTIRALEKELGQKLSGGAIEAGQPGYDGMVSQYQCYYLDSNRLNEGRLSKIIRESIKKVLNNKK